MIKDELYEIAMDYFHLYSICQHECDGMNSCKMFAEDNDKGCLKYYYHYLNLMKKVE